MTNAVPCPAPETIAAYLDRRLDPAERTRVEEHLADCEECRTLLSETALFLEADGAATAARRSPRAPWLLGLGAAATLLVGAGAWIAPRFAATPQNALVELDRALNGKRYVESRLSGFEYGEYVSPRRGALPVSSLPLEVLAAGGKVERLATRDDTASSLAALGASQVALRLVDDAVENLEAAARLAPRNARIQSDLAAAYLARFRAGDYPEDPAKAVEAAATAVALDPRSRAAAFNRALALEALPLRGEALRAWEAYLSLDSSSGWANEARAHIEELKRPLPPPAPPSPSAMLDELESDVFPAWGRAVLVSSAAEAEDTLEQARAIALQVQATAHDRLALDTLAAIDSASPARITSLARAHVLVGDGRQAYLGGRFAEADRAFAEAHDLLRDGRSPYADWVLMRRSTSRFQVGDPAGALHWLSELARTGQQSSTVVSRAMRMRGLLQARKGRLASALAHYRAAAAAARPDPAGGDSVALRFLLGETLDVLGENEAAWTELRAGLQAHPWISDQRQWHARLIDTVNASLRQNRPRLALHFLSTALVDSKNPLPARLLAESYTRRASIRIRLADREGADSDLGRAAEALLEVTETSSRTRLRSEWLVASAERSMPGQPEAAAAELTQAIDSFKRDGADWRLASCLLQRGRALLASGRIDEAVSDLGEGMSIADGQALGLPTDEQRARFLALHDELFRDRLKLALARGVDAIGSFSLAESARARSLKTAMSLPTLPRDVSEVVAALGERTALVMYSVLGDRLVVWQLDHRGGTMWSEPLPAERLDQLIVGLRSDIQRGIESVRAEELYDVLVRRTLGSGPLDTLAIVPDGSLASLPFAALRDRVSNRYLVEQVALVGTPSASLFDRTSAGVTPASILVLADPTRAGGDGSMQTLRFAREEAHTIAQLYARSDIRVRERATRRAFLDQAGHHDVVHFAGHARTNGTLPSRSRLLFASTEDGEPDSVSADEIGSRRFRSTSLVVLAGCSTGLGRHFSGEGSFHLARSVLVAGVPTVVATLWDVEDRAAAALLASFHRRYSRGAAAETAMRLAQMELIESSDRTLSRPIAWAGFEVIVASTTAASRG